MLNVDANLSKSDRGLGHAQDFVSVFRGWGRGEGGGQRAVGHFLLGQITSMAGGRLCVWWWGGGG